MCMAICRRPHCMQLLSDGAVMDVCNELVQQSPFKSHIQKQQSISNASTQPLASLP